MLLRLLLATALLGMPPAGLTARADGPRDTRLTDLDLSRPFGLPRGWHLAVTQGASVIDHGEPFPGRITLCIRNGESGPCDPALETGPTPDPDPQLHGFHTLDDARLVYPRGKDRRPLLLVQASSAEGFNGNRDIITQVLAYDAARHRFRRLYRFETGRNNNEEVRYIDRGPLRGAIISAVPQQGLPYGYWISVSRLTASNNYRQVLRYGSATLYGDNNPLGVIDSEMPNIQRRLGLWHAGMPLPVPRICSKPRLVHSALWCG